MGEEDLPEIMRIHETVRQGSPQEHLLHHYNMSLTIPPFKKGLMKSGFEIVPNPQAVLRFSEDKPRRKSELSGSQSPKKGQHTKHRSG